MVASVTFPIMNCRICGGKGRLPAKNVDIGKVVEPLLPTAVRLFLRAMPEEPKEKPCPACRAGGKVTFLHWYIQGER
jgi:hypothetical protein